MKSFPLTRLFVIIFFFLETLNLKSQINDSLIVIYKNASHDTIRVRVLLNIVSKICDSNPDSAIKTLTACQSICNKNFKIKNINPSTLYNFKLLSANTQLSLAYAYMLIGKMNEAAQIYRSVIPILKQLKNFDVLSNAYVFYASYYLNIGKLDTANYYAQISLKEAQKIKHGKLIAQAENILGLISDYKGDYVSALKYYLDGLKIASTTNDNKGIANFYRNIGGIYETQNKLDEAMKYYQNALKLRLKNNDEINVAESYNTIAIIYRKMNNLNEALIFNSKALEIQKMVHDMPGLALTYNNISVVYHDMKIYDKAANFLEKGIEVQIKINDLNGLSYSYNNLAVLNQENKKYDKAIFYANKSLSIAEKIAFPSLIDQSAKTLYNLYKKINNYQKALEYFTLHIKMRDSINNVDAQKLVIEQQANFEYSQKKAIEDVKHKLELSKQDDLAKAEKNKQRIVILSVTTLLIVVLIFSVFIYNRFKFTQKQKSVIELKEKETRDQKHIIEEKHKEITDSINYAERIQRSFLATKEMLDSNLNFSASSSAVEKSIGLDYARPDISQKETRPDNYFVFFKPKDVVSGDFYWAANLVSSSEVENDKGTINASTPLGVTKKLFCLATADSTGHGVPGAIMSLLNITSLEKAIETHTQPHEILNATR
ncbi:MAG: tetratricopeptide repeat protein, partial [Bacteroidetes bacterium]|nr:tetratricopeptide repeat protein [Bacteroidota bacterium]